MPNERKPRRTRVDSKDKQVEAMAAAKRIIVPPSDMEFTNQQTVVFSEIIDEFAKVDWSAHAIRLAAMLARTIVEAQKVQEELIDEGYTAESARGTPVQNPKVSVLSSMNSSILALRRSLSLQAMGRAVDLGKRHRHAKNSEKDSPLHDDEEDLIAVPDGR